MSFTIASFGSAGNQSLRGKAPMVFHYATADEPTDLLADGYFDDIKSMLVPGDTINVAHTDSLSPYVGVVEFNTFRVMSAGATYGVKVRITQRERGSAYRVPFQINETDLLAGTVQRFPVLTKGALVRVATVIQKQVTTGGTITATIDGTAVAGLSITVADAATVGTVQTGRPTAGSETARFSLNPGILGIVPSAAFASAGEINGWAEIVPQEKGDRVWLYMQFNQTDTLAGTGHGYVLPMNGAIVDLGVAVQVNVTTGDNVTAAVNGTAAGNLACTIANTSVAGNLTSGINMSTPETTAGTNVTYAAGQMLTVVPGAAFATAGAINAVVGVKPNRSELWDPELIYLDIDQTDLLAGTKQFQVSPADGSCSFLSTMVIANVTTGGNISVNTTGNQTGLLTLTANSSVAGNTSSGFLQDTDPIGANNSTTRRLAAIGLDIDSAFATAGAVSALVGISTK